MDAAQALAELAELSSQVEHAVVLDSGGAALASIPPAAPADGLARAALDAVAAAGELHASAGEVAAVEVELDQGGLFVLREGGLTVAATTGPDPTAGLVVYDLRTCLRRIEPPKPKRRRTARKEPAAE
jgi:predicted regulator of Ras-like GTPase activity (Roadblock/LC7/MglB family)